jgi:hypothetical protein
VIEAADRATTQELLQMPFLSVTETKNSNSADVIDSVMTGVK